MPSVPWRRSSAPVREPRVLVRFAAEGFDLADALEIVHEQRVHGAGGLALHAVAAVGGERVPERAAGEQRQGNQRDRGQRAGWCETGLPPRPTMLRPPRCLAPCRRSAPARPS